MINRDLKNIWLHDVWLILLRQRWSISTQYCAITSFAWVTYGRCLTCLILSFNLQLLGEVHRLPAPICQCSLEADRVQSSVSNCRVFSPAFQVHLQPGKNTKSLEVCTRKHPANHGLWLVGKTHLFFVFQPNHEGYFACLDIWSIFLDFLTTKIKSRLADRESVLNR